MSAPLPNLSRDELALRLTQQELVAKFGLFALLPGPFQRLVDEVCRVAAAGLGTQLSKVLHYRSSVDDLLIVAGVGWHAGVVGNSTLGSGIDSPAGYALHTGEPTLSNHLMLEERFRLPAVLAEHGVQSAINVVIGDTDKRPYGVLEVDSTQRHEFVDADTAFLQSLANVLAAGLARIEAEDAQALLLQDKDLLMREVHHRVKNSLQLVRTMLGLQARSSSDETRGQLDMAAGRIMSIAAVHQRLYQGGSVADADADAFLAALIGDIRALIEDAGGDRSIELVCEPMELPADTLTPLGLVVSELVTNALKHGRGRVGVVVRRVEAGLSIMVEDEGDGFAPDPLPATGLGMRLITALAKSRTGQAVQIDRTVPHSRVTVTLNL